MARKISVEIVGDASSLQRSFGKASSSARGFDRDLGRSARGALAASLSFRGLGRAATYASGYLIGGAGLAYALKTSIGNSESLEKAQRSLAVVVQRNGGNFKQQLPIVEKWAAAQDRFGVSTVEADQGLARATVITGTAAAGMRAYTEALEISKATGKSFSAVLLAAAKANEGQTTALARYIGKIPKGTTALQLFTMVQGKYAGQAAANTTATEKLSAAFSNIETLVGTALLPTVNKYSNELTAWLGKSKNQERIQRDVNAAVKDTKTVIGDLTHTVRAVSGAVGGFKNLLAELVALKVFMWARAAQVGVEGVGTAAAVAGGKVAALRTSLLGLATLTIAPIVIPIIAKWDAKVRSKGFFGKLVSDAALPSQAVTDVGGFLIRQVTKSGKDSYVNKPGYGQGAAAGGAGAEAAARAAAGKARTAVGAISGGDVSNPMAPLDRLSKIQNQVAEARLAVAKGLPGAQRQLVAALKAEIDYDAKYAAIQKDLADKGGKEAKKHAQTMQALLADEAAAYGEIKAGQDKVESAADKASKAAQAAAKKRAAEAKKRAQEAAQAAQTFTVPMNLLIAQAKAGTTSTTKDDVAVALKIKAFAESVIKSNKKKGQALVDAWNEITNQMSVIGTKAQPTGGFRAASLASLTAGLGLSPAARKMAEARLAQAQAHSGYIPTGQGVLGQTITINVHGTHDPDKVAAKVIEKINRKRTQTVTQRRGPNAGYQGPH